MSTGCECAFIEATPGEWFYILEDYDAPKNAWDWREYAEAYGPFPTFDEARTHLRDTHANPGGWWEQKYDPAHPYKPDEVTARLFKEARNRPRPRSPRTFWY
jgi:hypothetical protein